LQLKEKKRQDYTFWHQFNEEPSIIPGCPGIITVDMMDYKVVMTQLDGVELCKLGGCAGVDKHVHAP